MVRQSGKSANGRLPGLDTLRALATVLVVVLHAGVPYTTVAMPGLVWPVRHTATSPLVDVIYWSIAGCIMPVFFWLSGYGAAQSLADRGPGDFWRTRCQRIGVPLIVFAVILLPVELYVWLTGLALDGQIPWRKLQSLKLGSYHEGLWGLSHLWYLEYLLLYCGLLLLRDSLAGWAVPTTAASNVVGTVHSGTIWRSRFRVAALAGTVAAVLWWAPEVVVGFQHSFVPVPAKFAFSGIFFAAGVLTFRCGGNAAGRGVVPLVCAIVVFAVVFPWLKLQAVEDLHGMNRFIIAAGLGAFAALVTCGLWDVCVRQQRDCGRVVQFLSAGSYWTYLVHHPLVAIFQIALRPTGWPAIVQFTITTGLACAVCWISYAWLVEGTAIGALLNGRRSAPLPPVSDPQLRHAA